MNSNSPRPHSNVFKNENVSLKIVLPIHHTTSDFESQYSKDSPRPKLLTQSSKISTSIDSLIALDNI
jgi:hypothetical protein